MNLKKAIIGLGGKNCRKNKIMPDVIIKNFNDGEMFHIEVIGQSTKRYIIHKWIEENIPSYDRISHDIYWMKDEEYAMATKMRWM